MKFLIILTFLNMVAFAGQSIGGLTHVDSKAVCMVNDTHFGRDQIPVKVADKVYYGCCENCKKTLKEDKTARTAVDPLTKKPVDKATAYIGADKKGKVYYFENKENFLRFKKRK